MSVEFKGRTLDLEKSFFTLFPGLCKGCGLCIVKCPKQCISWSEVLGVYGTPSVEANDECIGCGICQNFCPDAAITINKKKKNEDKN